MSENGVISKNAAKDIVKILFKKDRDPKKIAEENGFLMNNDTGALEAVINSIISQNADIVQSYKNGNNKVFGFLMGQVIQQAGKSANPQLAKDLLTKKIMEQEG